MRLIVLVFAVAACGPGVQGGPTMNNHMAGGETDTATSPVVSSDILAREPLANRVDVKHILIGWKDLADAYGGRLDSRAEKRSKSDAEADVKKLVEQLKAGGDFDTLMKSESEDPGSASTGKAYPVTPNASLVIEFRQVSLRLRPGEIGVCQSEFGFHIVKRID